MPRRNGIVLESGGVHVAEGCHDLIETGSRGLSVMIRVFLRR